MKRPNPGGLVNSALRYDQQALCITHDGRTSRVLATTIVTVLECQMQDDVMHADEYCHILRLPDTFWLIGPFVDGVPHAIHALLRAHPELPRERMKLSHMPWRMRAPGLLGLRIWPIAGLGHYPVAELARLTCSGRLPAARAHGALPSPTAIVINAGTRVGTHGVSHLAADGDTVARSIARGPG